MSLRYRNNSGEETIIAGLTPGGDIEAGAVAEVRGSFDVPSTAVGNYSTVQVTFPDSFEMPSNDYLINIDTSNNSGFTYTVTLKSKTGFTVICRNIYTAAVTATTNYICTKTYTVQHDVANSEAIATIQQSIPAGAGSGNKLTTKSYVDNADNALDTRLDNLEDLIPVGASISNQLTSKLYVDNAIQNIEIDVDSALDSTSENPVQNKVVKAAIDAKEDKIFKGTKQEWSELTADEKKTYKICILTDDGEYIGNITNEITEGDMNAVTSNAVAKDKKHVTLWTGSISSGTMTLSQPYTNFRKLYFLIGIGGAANSAKIQKEILVDFISSSYTLVISESAAANSSVFVNGFNLSFPSATTVSIVASYNTGWSTPVMQEIVGEY